MQDPPVVISTEAGVFSNTGTGLPEMQTDCKMASCKIHGSAQYRVECVLKNNRGVAQLVERVVWDHQVARSSRVTPTRYRRRK